MGPLQDWRDLGDAAIGPWQGSASDQSPNGEDTSADASSAAGLRYDRSLLSDKQRDALDLVTRLGWWDPTAKPGTRRNPLYLTPGSTAPEGAATVDVDANYTEPSGSYSDPEPPFNFGNSIKAGLSGTLTGAAGLSASFYPGSQPGMANNMDTLDSVETYIDGKLRHLTPEQQAEESARRRLFRLEMVGPTTEEDQRAAHLKYDPQNGWERALDFGGNLAGGGAFFDPAAAAPESLALATGRTALTGGRAFRGAAQIGALTSVHEGAKPLIGLVDKDPNDQEFGANLFTMLAGHGMGLAEQAAHSPLTPRAVLADHPTVSRPLRLTTDATRGPRLDSTAATPLSPAPVTAVAAPRRTLGAAAAAMRRSSGPTPSAPGYDGFSSRTADDQEPIRAVLGAGQPPPARTPTQATSPPPPSTPPLRGTVGELSPLDDFSSASVPSELQPQSAPPPNSHPQGELPNWIVAHPDGTYSVHEFEDVPAHVDKPVEGHRRTTGAAYDAADRLSRSARKTIRDTIRMEEDEELHHKRPTFLGGSPDTLNNIQILKKIDHVKVTAFWNKVKGHIDKHQRYLSTLDDLGGDAL